MSNFAHASITKEHATMTISKEVLDELLRRRFGKRGDDFTGRSGLDEEAEGRLMNGMTWR